jgi:hypothetical protein
MTEEFEHEVEVNPVNPISNMIDYITQSEFEKANNIFNDLLDQRVSDALDQKKVAVAQAMYSSEDDDEMGDEATEVDEDDIEISDEEYEDALNDLEEDDDED